MRQKKHYFLAMCTAFALHTSAQQAPLKGFSYAHQPSAPTSHEWQSPEAIALNKEQPKAYFFSFADVASAQRVLPEHSAYYHSLDGQWSFRWVGNPWERDSLFQNPAHSVAHWDKVEVPMNWNIYGLDKSNGAQKYGTPIYVNQPVIFQHKVAVGDWKGGVMRTPPEHFTVYKHRNEVGSYRRNFSVPSTWKGQQIYINFDGVDSFFYLWINGKYVGFSKNSRNLAAFNITPYLNPKGENTVAVEVYRSSDGSFLEAQDMFRLPGIFRTVSLTAKPEVQLRDLKVIPDLDHHYRDGVLNITADVRNLSKKTAKGYTIDYQLFATPLFSDATTKVEGATASVAVSEVATQAIGQAVTQLRVANPNKWSGETPYRYVLVAQLKDKKGKVIETISTYTGFREVEIKNTPAHEDEFGLAGRYFYVNGKPVKLKGVNRHETHPATGHVLTREQMEEEIMLMRRANINHVRNSHYPPAPYFYYLADKYGIYLEDEANIESHQYYYGEASLSHVPEFLNQHIARNMEMVHATVNSPSIVIWSLGNEAGPGVNFVKAYEAIKAYDTSRPVQYERNNDIVDMGSNQYPSIPWVEWAVQGKANIKYPFHISEYAHSMGNAAGGLEDYWKAMESTNFFCGGAIWDWVDQAMYNYTQAGKRYLAYGGDFGDKPNDGMFVMNGILFADREPKPQYYEVKKVYQYVGFSAEQIGTGKVKVFNKNYYTNLADDYTLRWSVWENGLPIEEGTMAMPSVAARQSTIVTIPYTKAKLSSDKEYFLKLEALLKDDMPWAPKGYVQADEQLALRAALKPHTLAESCASSTQKLTLSNTDTAYPVVLGHGFKVVFDTKQGTIHSLTYGDQTIIAEGNGPKLDAFRAATDNDIWVRNGWIANGLHNLRHKAVDSHISQRADGTAVLSFTVESQAPNAATLSDAKGTNASGHFKITEQPNKPFGPDDMKFVAHQTWVVYPDGSIELQASISNNNHKVILTRLCYEFVLPKTLDIYNYYCRGPINNYGDRKASQYIEQHSSKVAEQFVNFPKPQSMANREDVRWAALTAPSGKGVLFVAGTKMSTSALPYDQLDLFLTPHPHELKAGGDTHLHIDIATLGLGGFSCGQGGPLEHDRVYGQPQHFSFAIRPLSHIKQATALASVSLDGRTAPSIVRSATGYVSLQAEPGAQLAYKIGTKGKAQIYTQPFYLREASEVIAWNANDKTLRSKQHFAKLDQIPVVVKFASSEEPTRDPASHLVDDNPDSFWHSMYSVTVAKYPHWVDFDAQEVKMLKGFTLLPRQDGNNGNIKDYKVQVSLDGNTWTDVTQGSFAKGKTLRRVLFDKPIKARYLRFVALSEQTGQDFATIAEFTILAE
ncbi:MAG: glycoside hydrolase family 2 TIM barrel-domain containing protein [Bacteroidales bacterium]|nr:glycoside hydrolase family 2 TIM barrel-domain containing protein [Bacteroidales bacterium]